MPDTPVSVDDSTLFLYPPPITRSGIVSRKPSKAPLVIAGISSFLAIVSLIAAGVMYGMLSVRTPQQRPVSRDDAVDAACVQVLRNGGLPDDCSRMYHVLPFP